MFNLALSESDNRSNDSPDVTYENNWYLLCDAHYNVMVVLDDSAAVVERVDYSAYGTPRHHYRADIDGDGDVDTADLNTINTLASGGGTAIEDAGYIAYADLDRDGDIDSTGYSIANTEGTHVALAEGVLTDSSIDNNFGYSGYLYTPTTKLYCLRLRWFSTDLGRFIERDPLGYVNGMNVYQYVEGSPIGSMDPYGLESDGAGRNDPHGRPTGPSIDKQIRDLEEKKKNATTRREKKKIAKKIQNLKKEKAKKAKGETHSRRAKGRGGRGARIIAFLAVVGAVEEAQALPNDVHRLMIQLSIAPDEATARLIALAIAQRMAEVNGTAAMQLADALIEAWWEAKRQRAKERRNRSREPKSDRGSPSIEEDTPTPEPRGASPDPCG